MRLLALIGVLLAMCVFSQDVVQISPEQTSAAPFTPEPTHDAEVTAMISTAETTSNRWPWGATKKAVAATKSAEKAINKATLVRKFASKAKAEVATGSANSAYIIHKGKYLSCTSSSCTWEDKS